MKDDDKKFQRTEATTVRYRLRAAAAALGVAEEELAELRAIAMQADPTEEDLARLKAAVKAGRYRADLEALATRMLWDPHAVAGLLSE